MADRELVLCAPLCFLVKRYDKLERKLLKSVLLEFFKPGDITAAKSLLETNVSSAAKKRYFFSDNSTFYMHAVSTTKTAW